MRLPLAFALTLTIALPFLALPATADEAADDLSAVRDCVEGADDARSCIGAVSGPCMETQAGQTTAGMDDCLGREEAAWDVLLNENYKAAMADARAQDENYEDSGLEPGAADSLKTAQRAWLAFREAECDRRFQMVKDGTIRTNVASACMLDLTAGRAIELAPE